MIPAGTYLLFGRTGVGKSSVINTLAQDSLANVNNARVCTYDISSYRFDSPGGSYLIYDSPGFCDDDNPRTDSRYLRQINFFLDENFNKSHAISLLFSVRIGSTRVRSEDFEVVKYLAELLTRFRIPIVFVATWADFSRGGEFVRSQLDKARIQYLAMLDKALLSITNQTLCANGFNGAYAVDNTSGIWLNSCNSIRVDLTHTSVPSAYEEIVGHKFSFILDWIHAAGHSFEFLVYKRKISLFVSRIENLTRLPRPEAVSVIKSLTDRVLPDFVSSANFECTPYYSFDSCEDDMFLVQILDPILFELTNAFRIHSVNKVPEPKYLSISINLFTVKISGILSAHRIRYEISACIAIIYAAREMIKSFYIALNCDKPLYKFHILEIMTNFRISLAYLFGIIDKAYLSTEILSFLNATFSIDETSLHKPDVIFYHFQNCLEILYLSTVYAEWVCFPRSDIDLSDEPGDKYWELDPDDIFQWSNSVCKLYGYSRLMLETFMTRDWYSIYNLSQENSQCMPSFLEDITKKLTRDSLLVSESKIIELSKQRNY
jgi:GTP-binding protein EngB required for normal cell division